MPTQQKETYRSVTSMQIKTRICFDSNLAYLDHSLPPLGLFLKIKLPREIDHRLKTPPFSHNQTFSPQETNF
jgi:hypothetical protein